MCLSYNSLYSTYHTKSRISSSSELSIALAVHVSSTSSVQSRIPRDSHPAFFSYLAKARYQISQDIYAHIPTTRAPFLQVQYHDLTLISYFIQNEYFLDDIWRLWIFALTMLGISVLNKIWNKPSSARCSAGYDFADFSWYTPMVKSLISPSESLGKSLTMLASASIGVHLEDLLSSPTKL